MTHCILYESVDFCLDFVEWLQRKACMDFFSKLKTDTLTLSEIWTAWNRLPRNPFATPEQFTSVAIDQFWDFLAVTPNMNADTTFTKRSLKHKNVLFFFFCFVLPMSISGIIYPYCFIHSFF